MGLTLHQKMLNCLSLTLSPRPFKVSECPSATDLILVYTYRHRVCFASSMEFPAAVSFPLLIVDPLQEFQPSIFIRSYL
jgi:hypothetical protein